MSIVFPRLANRITGLCLAGLMLAGCSAQEPTASAPMNSATPVRPAADEPRQLGLCASCHGRTGISSAANAPHLAGRDRTELLDAMQAYVDGTRNYPPMRAMLGPISRVDRERLADWYANQPRPAGEGG